MTSDTGCCPSGGHKTEASAAHMAKDPVCGMNVPLGKGKPSFSFEGADYHFCCQGCHDKFSADPEFYLTGGHHRRAARATNKDVQYTCPMHPEIIEDEFTDCPLCGMALEPMGAPADGPNPELVDFTKRFILSSILTLPILVLSMGPMVGFPVREMLGHTVAAWLELAFALPVVLWAGAPFFKRGWSSLENRSPNMWTLIAVGVGAAFLYSIVAVSLPDLFPDSIRLANGTVPVYFESAAVIICLVFLGQILELKAREQTGDAIRALMDLAPKTACRMNANGQERVVPLENILPEDTLRIRPGESVPVDGTVLEGNSSLDESMLTGEALPVVKGPRDTVTAGTLNIDGSLIIRAEKVGDETALAAIIELVAGAQRSRAPIQNLADKVAAWFVPTVVFIALAAFTIWLIWGPVPTLSYALIAAVSVLIIACPCALGMATPMSVMAATGRSALAGILIRNAEGLENLARIDTLVTDKTGTLTEGKPAVQDIIPAGEWSRKSVLALAAGLETGSEHPLAEAIRITAKNENIAPVSISNFSAVSGMGAIGLLPNGPVAIGNKTFMGREHIDISELAETAQQLEQVGKTVVYIAVSGQVSGLISFADTIKSAAAETITVLKNQGIEVIMATGDSEGPAHHIADQLGISDVRAGLLPADKKSLVDTLMQEGHIVAMAGDGINDAPALAAAHVGIAMGTGMDVSLESADMTVLKGDISAIRRAHILSRKTIGNIRQNLLLAFGYNSLCVPIAAGILYPLTETLLSPMIAAAAMSLSSVSVIGNALRLRNVNLDE